MVNAHTDYQAPGYATRFARARALDAVAQELWANQLAAVTGDRIQGTVLDAGAGTGRFLPVLRTAWRPRHLIAMDRSPAMLSALEVVSDVTVVVADLEHLPIGDSQVDACLCSMVLHHLDDPTAACAAMRRSLVPGGVLCVRTGTQETIASYTFLSCFPTALSAERAAMPTREQVVGWLEDAGFEQVTAREVRRPVDTTSLEHLRRVLSRGFPSLQLVPPLAFALGSIRFLAATAWRALRGMGQRDESSLLVSGVRP